MWKSHFKRGQSNNERRNTSDSDGENKIAIPVKALAAALSNSQSRAYGRTKFTCEFCEKRGHTEDRCFINPDNPNNKIPKKMLQRFAGYDVVQGNESKG